MRKYVTKNQFYPHLLILCEAVMEWLQKLTFSQFCSIMGIDKSELVFVVLWELTGKLVFIMDSRFRWNDTNTIIVIPAKAGIHPMQDSFPRYLPKSRICLRNLFTLT
jgi:hypothetical protein